MDSYMLVYRSPCSLTVTAFPVSGATYRMNCHLSSDVTSASSVNSCSASFDSINSLSGPIAVVHYLRNSKKIRRYDDDIRQFFSAYSLSVLTYTVTPKTIAREADQGKDGWITCQKTVKCSTCHFLMSTDLRITGNNGDQLSRIAKLEMPERADSSTSP